MRVFKVLLMLVVVAVAAGVVGFRYWQAQLLSPLTIEKEQIFEVPRGASLAKVVSELQAAGIVEASWPYKVWARLEPTAVNGLRAGEFRLTPNLNGRELVALLSSDDVVSYTLTVPEGWTFAQLRTVMNAAPKLEHTTQDMSDDALMAAIGAGDEKPEGRFFPDTYRYHKGVSDVSLLKRAHKRMTTTLEEVWAGRDKDLPISSDYEALILASLIERETGAPEERDEIAGVFKRRLERGMRLQTDPTVIYGLGDDYDGSLSRADLRKPTAWNTYVITGLPPTPIAMPGRAALEAAVHPKAGDTYYFVAKGEGRHQFSRTLSEHNAAVRRYILNRD
ncbi:endolytic transglycosylase MltG [Cobetia sp. L2A1]|uniref:endolytic transglycosylase MltG n=1 Tax=Cobetia sp. L2A1 TaxID=2686360 RepID=UPI00131CB9C9|nr:endolytic transglycosylase MltG [Cobetia sp. L2A1]